MEDASSRLDVIEAALRKGGEARQDAERLDAERLGGERLGGERLIAPRREAHALKSAAATMGLARLAAIARELEDAAQREDAPRCESLGAAARAAFDEARPFVAEILSAA